MAFRGKLQPTPVGVAKARRLKRVRAACNAIWHDRSAHPTKKKNSIPILKPHSLVKIGIRRVGDEDRLLPNPGVLLPSNAERVTLLFRKKGEK